MATESMTNCGPSSALDRLLTGMDPKSVAPKSEPVVMLNELAAALCKTQAEITHAVKDSTNPAFKSKYADLASVWEAVRIPMTKNGLSVTQLPSANGDSVTVTTILLHTSGQYIKSELTMTPRDQSPQAVGSCITYARRYALSAVLGVAPDDDDGEAAQRGSDSKPAAQAPRASAFPIPAGKR